MLKWLPAVFVAVLAEPDVSCILQTHRNTSELQVDGEGNELKPKFCKQGTQQLDFEGVLVGTTFSADFPVGEAAPGDCEMLAAVCKVHSVIKVATAREPNEAAAESKRLRPHAGTKALGCIVALCEQVVCGPSCCNGYRCGSLLDAHLNVLFL